MYSLVDSTKKKKVTVDWLTPPKLIELLGPFDLDPCASVGQPWKTAKRMIVLPEDGLEAEWNGFVFCNPPYGSALRRWTLKMASHNNGIYLVPGAIEVKWFRPIWQKASGIFFFHDRVMFYYPASKGPFLSGTLCPNKWRASVLVAFGQKAKEKLSKIKVAGSFISNWDNRPGIVDIYSGATK